MGEETTRLREEIDRSRQHLTRDVNLLAEKTSPTRMVERRVKRTRRGLIGLKDKVMGSSSAGRHRTDDAYGPTYPEDVHATESGGVGSKLQSAKESTMGAATHAAESTRETLSSAREHVSQAGERASAATHDAVTGVREQTEGNPLAAGLVAFGIGWLVSSLLPASEAETQVAQRAGELAGEHSGPVREEAKQAASEVGQSLQEHAQDAAQQVKERTQEAAGTVREEAKSAARR